MSDERREEAIRQLSESYPAPSTGRVVLLSGGADSYATLLLALRDDPEAEVFPIGFDYGQKCVIELRYAMRQIVDARKKYPLALIHGLHVVTLRGLSGSSMLYGDSRDPSAYEKAFDDYIPGPTNVPQRNATFLAIAYGYAESVGAGSVWTGLLDTGAGGMNTPDGRIEFVRGMQLALLLGSPDMTLDRREVRIEAPVQHHPRKLGSVVELDSLGGDLSLVWSCYGKGPVPCGCCQACSYLIEAVELLPFVRKTMTTFLEQHKSGSGSGMQKGTSTAIVRSTAASGAPRKQQSYTDANGQRVYVVDMNHATPVKKKKLTDRIKEKIKEKVKDKAKEKAGEKVSEAASMVKSRLTRKVAATSAAKGKAKSAAAVTPFVDKQKARNDAVKSWAKGAAKSAAMQFYSGARAAVRANIRKLGRRAVNATFGRVVGNHPKKKASSSNQAALKKSVRGRRR